MRKTANRREPITKQSLIWKDEAERLKKEQRKVAGEITPWQEA